MKLKWQFLGFVWKVTNLDNNKVTHIFPKVHKDLFGELNKRLK